MVIKMKEKPVKDWPTEQCDKAHRESPKGPGNGMKSHLSQLQDVPFVHLWDIYQDGQYERIFGHG